MMNPRAICLAAAVLAAGSTYAFAQPKSASKPGAAAPAKPSAAPAKPGAAAPANPAPHGGMHGGMAMDEGGCPMHDAAAIADAKVEDTPQGAILRLTAKRPEDVQKVRELAQRMTACMSGQGCMMHGEHGQGGMKH